MHHRCEHEIEVARLSESIFDITRLAMMGEQRDVEMYVHRLAYRYRNTPLGIALASVDRLHGAALRCEPSRSATIDSEILAITDRINNGQTTCGATWRDTEATGWLWHCSLPADHLGPHHCVGAAW